MVSSAGKAREPSNGYAQPGGSPALDPAEGAQSSCVVNIVLHAIIPVLACHLRGSLPQHEAAYGNKANAINANYQLPMQLEMLSVLLQRAQMLLWTPLELRR
jgi:hypothetical protein